MSREQKMNAKETANRHPQIAQIRRREKRQTEILDPLFSFFFHLRNLRNLRITSLPLSPCHSTPNGQGTEDERHGERGSWSARVGEQPVARERRRNGEGPTLNTQHAMSK
jgi:hypothetical protein